MREQIAPAGVEEHRIALAQCDIVHFEPSLQVLRRDHGSLVEAGVLARRIGVQLAGILVDFDEVDDDAARGERLQVFEAKPRHVVLIDVFAHRRLIVIAIAAADMADAVYVGADMALAEPRVFHIGEVVFAKRCARR